MIPDVGSRIDTVLDRFAPAAAVTTGAVDGPDGLTFAAMLGTEVGGAGGTALGATPGTLGALIGRLSGTGMGATQPWTIPAGRAALLGGGGGAAFAPLFAEAGARYGVDPALLAAVAKTESGFRPDVVSPAGAIGLMQIMPATAAALGVDPRDPAQAVDGAARYLRQMLDQFGDLRLAVAAYNAGPGAVAQHGGIPPYPETQAYVTKVLGELGVL